MQKAEIWKNTEVFNNNKCNLSIVHKLPLSND